MYAMSPYHLPLSLSVVLDPMAIEPHYLPLLLDPRALLSTSLLLSAVLDPWREPSYNSSLLSPSIELGIAIAV
jgi:hypothetical protein